jgi:hypothetical protein
MRFFERYSKQHHDIKADNSLEAVIQAHDKAQRNLNYARDRATELLPLLREEAGLQVALNLAENELQSAKSRVTHETILQGLEIETHAAQVRIARLKGMPEPDPPAVRADNSPTQADLAQKQESYDAVRKNLDEVREKILQGDSEIRRRHEV